ncbi:hypothetical protein WG915_07545 [Corynebacterium sp. H128]|uniref:DUF6918 family protein n=1 Tax=unclassified Corynebacterium TaxID=2624378 RepID=UPI0030B31CC0
MSSLSEQLTGPTFDALAIDLAEFASTTVNNQSGITGMALKGGLAAATKARPNIVEQGMSKVLPDVIEILSPYWDNKPADSSFGAHLDANKEQVADELMTAADRLSKSVSNPTLLKVYGSVRGKATKVIAQNLVGLGDIVEKHAA